MPVWQEVRNQTGRADLECLAFSWTMPVGLGTGLIPEMAVISHPDCLLKQPGTTRQAGPQSLLTTGLSTGNENQDPPSR